jgi:hypothetical protein
MLARTLHLRPDSVTAACCVIDTHSLKFILLEKSNLNFGPSCLKNGVIGNLASLIAPARELTQNLTFQELRAIPLQLLNPSNRPCNHLEATHEPCFGFGAKAAYSGPGLRANLDDYASSLSNPAGCSLAQINTATSYLFTRVRSFFAGLAGAPSFGIVRKQNLDKPRGDMKVGCL